MFHNNIEIKGSTMTQILTDTYLDYSDILIKPKMGKNLNSRKEVNLVREYKFKRGQVRRGLGVFNANMSTCGNFETAKHLLKDGMFATIHKFYTPEEIINFMRKCQEEKVDYSNLFISIGIKNGIRELDKLKEVEDGAMWLKPNICIDAPNFYIDKAFEVLEHCRELFPDSVIMCGNIASSDICHKLLDYADILKIGIGSGSVCTTRKMTGCGVPMVSLILECADVVHSVGGMICADGGIVEVGDICKAFCLNSDFIMSGGMFAGTDEAEGEIIEKCFETGEYVMYDRPKYKEDMDIEKIPITPKYEYKKYKLYYGMSSTLANNKFAGGMCDYKASEGREVLIPYTGSLDKILQDIRGGIASACTYVGSVCVKDMSKCATVIKVNNTINKVFEKYEK
jgi:GMP reductase